MFVFLLAWGIFTPSKRNEEEELKLASFSQTVDLPKWRPVKLISILHSLPMEDKIPNKLD